MSSGFVSAGTNEDSTRTNDEWERAKEEIEKARKARTETPQNDGKSLYEVLQSNKAAKEEAFQESIKLKNQFRTLGEDEVEFLDSVMESTRAQEAAVKKETAEQLDVFRKQQQNADKALVDDPEATTGERETILDVEEEQWAPKGRKRRKGSHKDANRGLKLRKSSTAEQQAAKTSENGQSTAKSDAKSVEADDAKASQKTQHQSTAKRQAETKASSDSKSNGDNERSSSRPTTTLLGVEYDSDDD